VTENDRHSVADVLPLATDPDELARREVENGLRQFNVAMDLVKAFVHDPERPFRLRSSHILQLNYEALQGIQAHAGTYRNSKVHISQSTHEPPEHFFVAEEVERMCDYVNDCWGKRSPVHLAAYLMWKLNWIHPFADGNGRTSRMVSYVVLNIGLNSVLPGIPTIPDQIVDNKKTYYDALERADNRLKEAGVIDVSSMEELVEGMLATQLLRAADQAVGH